MPALGDDVSSLVTNTSLCGANLGLDGYLSQLKLIEADLLSGVDLDASALRTQLEASLNQLDLDLRKFVPELPSFPTLSLQSELKNLLNLSPTSSLYTAKLLEITNSFGAALTTAGQDLNTIVLNSIGALQGGTDICSMIPNFEAVGSTITEKAPNILQAAKDATKEIPSELGDVEVETAIAEMNAAAETVTNTALAFFKSPASVMDSYSDPSGDGAYAV